MIISTLKIGGREYVIVPRKAFDQLRKKAALLTDEDVADVIVSRHRLRGASEKRVAWSDVKKRSSVE